MNRHDIIEKSDGHVSIAFAPCYIKLSPMKARNDALLRVLTTKIEGPPLLFSFLLFLKIEKFI